MSLSTEYRGYTIRYNDNSDEWTCADLGRKNSAPTLSKMKANIDDYLRSIRKEAAVICYELNAHLSIKLTEATVTEYIGPTIDGSSWGSNPRHVSGHKVAIAAKREGNERIVRREGRLKDCVPMTEEAAQAITEAKRLERIAKAAQADYERAIKAIPRLTIDDVAGLVKASGVDPTGGLKPEGGKP
jgi:hypothetical protein